MPYAGAIAANFTSPDNATFSGLCVEAVAVPPPPTGTPEQIQWQVTEMGCFIHWNMATAHGTQGSLFAF